MSEINDYKNNFKWVEIIRRLPREKEETPTERVRKKIEETLEYGREILKSIDVDKIAPTIRSQIADEEAGIKAYEELHNLFIKISIATGMLENEAKALQRIIKDEKEHKKELQRILSELTR